MVRKLAVTLVASVIYDPYLQILCALLILVVSCVVTAYVVPYEVEMLNLLDVGSLFVLIVTQIISITYFYAESVDRPFMESKALDALTTTVLILLNAAVVIAFFAAYVGEVTSLRERWSRHGMRRVKVVVDKGEVMEALHARRHRASGTLEGGPGGEVGAGVSPAIVALEGGPGCGAGAGVAPAKALEGGPEGGGSGAGVAQADEALKSGPVGEAGAGVAPATIAAFEGGPGYEAGAGVAPAAMEALEGGPSDGGDSGAVAQDDHVTDENRDDDGDGDGSVLNQWWHHPCGVAVRDPPQQIPSLDGTSSEWVWRDANGSIAASLGLPELLIAMDSVDSLRVGDRYRWVHNTTLKLSKVLVKLEDVGGTPCCWDKRDGDVLGVSDEATGPVGDTDAIAASRSCVAVEVLNPITRLAIEAEGASVAVSAATMNRSTAFGAVQRLIGDVRLKVDVARARRAADTRRDGGEETGVVMRNRAAKL